VTSGSNCSARNNAELSGGRLTAAAARRILTIAFFLHLILKPYLSVRGGFFDGNCYWGRLANIRCFFVGLFGMKNSLVVSKCLLFVVLVVAAGLSACTTVETQSFRVNKNAAVESAQISTDADFSRYSSLLAEDMGVFFSPDSPSTDEDVQRIRQIFRDAFFTELKGYEIVSKPGPTTMAVQASLVDLRHSSGGQAPGMRREIRDLAVPGSLVFLMEMKDSRSGAVLARAADSATAPTFATSNGAETDWSSVQQAAQHWATLFRQFLDANLAR